MAEAHPRSRGENVSSSVRRASSIGSSPLTRGKLDISHRLGLRMGLIPAHAGKTRIRNQRRTRHAAHPRSRGENPYAIACAAIRQGSSPLTRGKHALAARSSVQVRLIPAHAGKTLQVDRARRQPGAHPRSRGENCGRCESVWRAHGSSPLTRGKPTETAQSARFPRLIPAHAGKTCTPHKPGGAVQAHPRSRGENTPLASLRALLGGSSPLTRGKRRGGAPLGRLARLIPAHAGKTITFIAQLITSWAHPRSRGENMSVAGS